MAPVTLVGTMRYGSKPSERRPIIDTSGQIVYDSTDGETVGFQVPAVSSFFAQQGRRAHPEFNTDEGIGRGPEWQLTLTNSRLLVFAEHVIGAYGRTKYRARHVTAGQFKFEWIDVIELSGTGSERTLSLLSTDRGGYLGRYLVCFHDLEQSEAQVLWRALAERLARFWTKRGHAGEAVARALAATKPQEWSVQVGALLDGAVMHVP